MNEALLSLLDANPDDAGTWAVLADWLEERGDPRAEFMRLTRDVEFPDPALPEEQQRRLSEAFVHAEAAWFPDVKPGPWTLIWRHGFVSRVLYALGPDWLSSHHYLPHVELREHPALRFIRELNVADVEYLPGSLPHLRVLRCSKLRPDGLELFAAPRLELAVLSETTLNWPAHLPTPHRLHVVPPTNYDRRLRPMPTYNWAKPIPSDPSRPFCAPPAKAGVPRCAACGSTRLRHLLHTWRRGEDNGGTFHTNTYEAQCERCGTFTLHEYDV